MKHSSEELDLIDLPCCDSLDLLWREVILSKYPDYGDWEYPGQAYRHLKAEFEDLNKIIAQHEATIAEYVAREAAHKRAENVFHRILRERGLP